MTISVTDAVAGPYLPNGVTTQFPYFFKSVSGDEVEVLLQGGDGSVQAVPRTAYSVTVAADGEGGTVTMLTPPAADGRSLFVSSDPSFEQDILFEDEGPFNSAVLNPLADRGAARDIYLRNRVDRAVRVPFGEAGFQLPVKSLRTPGALVGWDGAGRFASKSPLEVALLVTSALTPILPSTAFDLVGQWLSPEMFGAKGDGVTNDTSALVALRNAIIAKGGGAIQMRAGATYLVGRQTFAGATGKGYSYLGEHIFLFQDLPRPVVIDGNGASMKYATGLRFGGYDPVTGAKLNVRSTNADNYAHIGYCIYAARCAGLYVRNLYLDGSNTGALLGGEVGDTGYQAGHYGVVWQATPGYAVQVTANDFCLDGFAVSHPGATEMSVPLPVVLEACVARRNCRQGLSWVGGLGLTTIGCSFTDTGKGPFQSLPGAGIDIEPEQAPCRNGRFINTLFANNAGVGALSAPTDRAPADMTFEGCQFYGTTSAPLWANGARFRYKNCLISGLAIINYAGARGDAPLFEDCVFTTDRYQNIDPNGNGLFDASAFARFSRCFFFAGDAQHRLGTSVASCEYYSCTFQQQVSTATSFVRGVFSGFNVVTMVAGANDFNGSVNYGRLTGSGTWQAIDNANGEAAATTPPILRQRRMGYNGSVYKQYLEAIWSDPNFAGTAFSRGDVVRIAEPNVGSPFLYVNTSPGQPGTMSPVGVVGMVRAAAPQVTYTGPSGGTTVDAEGRAALAKLAVDVAELRSKLAAANITA